MGWAESEGGKGGLRMRKEGRGQSHEERKRNVTSAEVGSDRGLGGRGDRSKGDGLGDPRDENGGRQQVGRQEAMEAMAMRTYRQTFITGSCLDETR